MSSATRYGAGARMLHRLAFRFPMTQKSLAEVEEQLFADLLERTDPGPPVFVTSLPRSGTTILLRLLWESGAFASTLYRDMPFVLSPLLWARFARRFEAGGEPVERDHGDGIAISGASPEGFEEVLWKRFWPEHYLDDRIRPWDGAPARPEFERALDLHMRKIVALRSADGGRGSDDARGGGAGPRSRYLSKNNLNIARLADPPSPLRRGTVLVPVREPLQHAASLRRQHLRFRALQEEDPFLREYMESIGHHEFGKSLKPVDFEGWLERSTRAPEDPAFWLEYWVATFRRLLDRAPPNAVFLSYERLTSSPEDALERLAGVVDVEAGRLTSQAGRLHPPRSHPVERDGLPGALLEEAEDLYRRLEARAESPTAPG
ncbi:MAG TPA: hypothetical protein VKA44_02650 [Gemmatimonadota bacterium]|nr:hypothetical protein [Gemmatimonadota bacterium]